MYRENYVGINGINRLNANYAAAFLKLAKHYKLADEIAKQNVMLDMARRIAKTSGDDELLQYIKDF